MSIFKQIMIKYNRRKLNRNIEKFDKCNEELFSKYIETSKKISY